MIEHNAILDKEGALYICALTFSYSMSRFCVVEVIFKKESCAGTTRQSSLAYNKKTILYLYAINQRISLYAT